MPRPARLRLSLALCAGLVAGCGGETPTVGSAAYLSQCRSEIAKHDKIDARFSMTARQVADLCACVQKEIVRQGFGDRHTDDDALDRVGPRLTRGCEAKVLAGR